MAVNDVVTVFENAGTDVFGIVREQYNSDGEIEATDGSVETALITVLGGAGGSGSAQRVLVKGTDPGEFTFTGANS